jgi:hypothetical protein
MELWPFDFHADPKACRKYSGATTIRRIKKKVA